jgi:hypothetical protein
MDTNLIKIAAEKGYHFDNNNNLIGPYKKILHPSLSTKGYPKFTIKINGVYKHLEVHRLKAYFLFGEIIFNKDIEVRHLNGVRTDYSNDNLSYGSRQDNRLDMPKKERIRIALLGASHVRKVTCEQRNEIVLLKKSGLRLIDIAKKFGLKSKGTVSMIINKKGCYSGL